MQGRSLYFDLGYGVSSGFVSGSGGVVGVLYWEGRVLRADVPAGAANQPPFSRMRKKKKAFCSLAPPKPFSIEIKRDTLCDTQCLQVSSFLLLLEFGFKKSHSRR